MKQRLSAGLNHVLESTLYKLVGTRANGVTEKSAATAVATASIPTTATTMLSSPLLKGRGDDNYGQSVELDAFLRDVSSKRIVFFGEVHSVPEQVALQTAILQSQQHATQNDMTPNITQENQNMDNMSKVHVVLEHFSLDMQTDLQAFQEGKFDVTELIRRYKAVGTENHDLLPYIPLLEYAQQNSLEVKLHAGFLPRPYARMVMREGVESALHAAKAKHYLPEQLTDLKGTESHYRIFESLLTGRNPFEEGSEPTNQFRKLFPAQLIKDESMAHTLHQLFLKNEPEGKDKYLVLAGRGHMLHFSGVPEKVFQHHPELVNDSVLIIGHESDGTLDASSSDEPGLWKSIEKTYGPKGANPGDYLFIYDAQHADEAEAVKAETAQAYDKVGETAYLKGNLKLAKQVMGYLGYTDEEFDMAGEDAYNYQGVGNPHSFAKIQNGESVLDVGSGLGIDSFIAAHYAGPNGQVTGLDLSKMEVKHATERAQSRDIADQNLRFVVGDMEQMPFEDESFDVVISNGAFCLAPNKEKAFEEIYRTLKPGGRMAIYTSTVKVPLEAGVNWPVCMRMFIHHSELQPLCEKIGFKNVTIDDSNSLMQYNLPGEDEGDADQPSGENGQHPKEKDERNRVHVGSAEFKHLQDYDMNAICARVCVIATKPKSAAAQVKES